jgi:CBS domain-containing protein
LRQVVVDEQGRLAGVLSRGDVLRAVINNFNIYMRSTDA